LKSALLYARLNIMGFGRFFDFTDASLRGDLKWAQAARWTAWAAPLVLTILVLAIVQIVLGVLIIVAKDNTLTLYVTRHGVFRRQTIRLVGWRWVSWKTADSNSYSGTVIQALIIPGLSFFNAIPSAHLHILARSNPPKLAIWFSTILAICYLASSIVYLVAGCFSGSYDWRHPDNSLEKNDCPSGDSKTTWDVNVALQLVSFVCYALHAAMAVRVFLFHRKRTAAIADGTLVEEIDLEAKARREQEARERWQRIVDL
jgi:hypothetical protein